MWACPMNIVCLFVCTCSSAIMKYLVKKCDLPDHWYPKEHQMQAKVDEYLSWHAANLRQGAASRFFFTVAPLGNINRLMPGARSCLPVLFFFVCML